MQFQYTSCSLEEISQELSKHYLLTKIALEELQKNDSDSRRRAIALLESWELQADLYLDELRYAIKEKYQCQTCLDGKETPVSSPHLLGNGIQELPEPCEFPSHYPIAS